MSTYQSVCSAAKNKIYLFLIFILSCQTTPMNSTQNPQQKTIASASYKNYISYDLDFAPYKKKREELEKKLSINLKNRGEAHITLITPPEYDQLKKHLSDEEIHQAAQKFLKTKPQFEILCTGTGSKVLHNQNEKTFFLVVKSEELLRFRQELTKNKNIPTSEFNPQVFYPHITLGFTERDLHIDDGVIKDKSACLK